VASIVFLFWMMMTSRKKLTNPVVRLLATGDEEDLGRCSKNRDCATDGARSDGVLFAHFESVLRKSVDEEYFGDGEMG
jgi:hypothetical protein